MREEKKEELACVDYVADESDRSGMRAAIRVKKDADVSKLLSYLYKYTDLEVTFGINMVVTADGKPSAHYENTLAVTKDGCDILSL